MPMNPMRPLLLCALFACCVFVSGWSAEEAQAAADAAADAAVDEGLPMKIAETFRRGGVVMWVLLVTSIVGLTFALERFVSLRRSRQIPSDLMNQLQKRLDNQGLEPARRLLREDDSSLARVLDGILGRGDADRAERERFLEDETGRVLWDLRHNIRPVGIVASIAPLIGLLGTVFGLIAAFQKAAELGLDDPRKFSAGIYEALYTTAFGLAVAIPFLILYHYLRGAADVLVREIEDMSLRFIIDLDHIAVSEPDPEPGLDREAA